MKQIQVANLTAGGDSPLLIISGPCVAESREMCLRVGETLRDKCAELGFGYVFKASFDKANRSSISSYRGMEVEEGAKLFSDLRDTLGTPVTTDVHESSQPAALADSVDLLQIPAFLCRQTDLLVAAAQTGLPVNVKKGQFLSPTEMQSVVEKLEQANAAGIMLTERGTFFGYQRLVNDFIGLTDMMALGQPVCFDVTHSTQLPGGSSNDGARITGGRPDCAPMLAKCAVIAGVHALFIETHPDPPNAKSDSATMLRVEQTVQLLEDISRLREAI